MIHIIVIVMLFTFVLLYCNIRLYLYAKQKRQEKVMQVRADLEFMEIMVSPIKKEEFYHQINRSVWEEIKNDVWMQLREE